MASIGLELAPCDFFDESSDDEGVIQSCAARCNANRSTKLPKNDA